MKTLTATLGAALSAALLTTQPAFAAECNRPTDPGGASGYDYGAASVNSFGNAQVLVWYTTSGPHAVNLESSRSDGVPDDVVKVADIHRTPTAIRRIVPQTSAGSFTGASTLAGVGGTNTGINYGTAPAGSVPIAQSTPALAQYASLFVQAGQKYGISPNLLAAVAKVESGGNASAVSSAGARGLMQFMPGTAAAFGVDPMDPAQAIDGAARLLSQMQTKFGSTELALASYNAGEGAVRRAGGIPPYGETQAYVTKVMGLLGAST